MAYWRWETGSNRMMQNVTFQVPSAPSLAVRTATARSVMTHAASTAVSSRCSGVETAIGFAIPEWENRSGGMLQTESLTRFC